MRYNAVKKTLGKDGKYYYYESLSSVEDFKKVYWYKTDEGRFNFCIEHFSIYAHKVEKNDKNEITLLYYDADKSNNITNLKKIAQNITNSQTPTIMTNQKKIDELILNINAIDRLLITKEIKYLSNILQNDEDVINLTKGYYKNGNGLVVLTSKRVIFINKGIFKLTVEDFPKDKISSIQYEIGLVFGNITIFSSGNKATIEQMDKVATKKIAEDIRQMTNIQ